MRKKWTYEEVKSFIDELGGKLLSDEYLKQTSKLELMCPCGTIFTRTFDIIKRNKSIICKSCRSKEKGKMYKKTLKEIKTFVEENGCQLLSTTYENEKSMLSFRCECGEVFSRMWKTFRQGCTQCDTCALNSVKTKNTLPPQRVTQYLREHGCELLSEYTSSKENITFKCSCGIISEKTFDNFKKHPYCKECGWKEIAKKKLNPLIGDADREKRRLTPEYRKLIKQVMERDNYECQVCHEKGKRICVHHILPYLLYKECRYDEYNLLTLCEECHRGYHSYCGGSSKMVNVNLTTFEEWLGKELHL